MFVIGRGDAHAISDTLNLVSERVKQVNVYVLLILIN